MMHHEFLLFKNQVLESKSFKGTSRMTNLFTKI